MKAIGFWIYDTYNFFFSLKANPLRFIPNAFTQYILMFYLSVMWTVVFTLWTGYSIYFGIGSVGGHLLVISAFFITALTFHFFLEADYSTHKDSQMLIDELVNEYGFEEAYVIEVLQNANKGAQNK